MTHKFSKLVLTAGISALLGTTAVVAQDHKAIADVPFTFHASQTTMPAGKYTVAEQTATGVLRLVNADGRGIYVTMHPGKAADPEQPKLTFVHQGDDYVLEGISLPGNNSAWEASQSSIEKNLSRKLGVAAMVSVPLAAR